GVGFMHQPMENASTHRKQKNQKGVDEIESARKPRVLKSHGKRRDQNRGEENALCEIHRVRERHVAPNHVVDAKKNEDRNSHSARKNEPTSQHPMMHSEIVESKNHKSARVNRDCDEKTIRPEM